MQNAAGPREVRVDRQLSGHPRWSWSCQVISGRALISSIHLLPRSFSKPRHCCYLGKTNDNHGFEPILAILTLSNILHPVEKVGAATVLCADGVTEAGRLRHLLSYSAGSQAWWDRQRKTDPRVRDHPGLHCVLGLSGLPRDLKW